MLSCQTVKAEAIKADLSDCIDLLPTMAGAGGGGGGTPSELRALKEQT